MQQHNNSCVNSHHLNYCEKTVMHYKCSISVTRALQVTHNIGVALVDPLIINCRADEYIDLVLHYASY